MRLRIDVVSDVICPWCFVGKRRLEKALRALGSGVEAMVEWHPFQLNPEMPRQGIDRKVYREAKFGDPARSEALDARLTEVGASEGLRFAFDRIRRTPNTFDAHRLIWLARREGAQDHVVEELFRRYFIEGEDVGDRQTLLDVAATCGLDRERADGFLASEAGTADVRQAEAEFRELGIEGVPHFIVDGKYGISGAQSPEILLSAFEQIIGLRAAPAGRAADNPSDR
ncbi:MAG TPA: DsbA family oxidoreductase [bacterium]|nr:DsbA family oxidoreductase [bacterium]